MQANHGHAGAASRDCVDDCERLNSACEGATELCEVVSGTCFPGRKRVGWSLVLKSGTRQSHWTCEMPYYSLPSIGVRGRGLLSGIPVAHYHE
eukprot:s8587_g2.t1